MKRKLNHAAKGSGFFVRFSSLVLAAVLISAVFAGLSIPRQSVKAANYTKDKTGASGYNAETIGNTASNIYWTNATYFDYLSDAELTNGWLNGNQAGTGFNGSSDDWYPFKQLNSVISGIADNNSSWSKPLYFGNYCNIAGSYDRSTHNGADYSSSMTSGNMFSSFITSQVTRFNYAANNSNGLSNLHQSYQGLMRSSLSPNNKKLMVTSSTPAPYFDASSLSGKVKTVSSMFPFRTSKSVGGKTTYYDFDSNNARDNVYFTWQSTGSSAPNDVVKPVAVNYATGTSNGVEDGLKYFMNPSDTYVETGQTYGANKYYGIFPFNNRKSHGDNKTTAANTRYLYASKDSTNWSDLYCYFFDNSGNYVGKAFPGYKMESYYGGGTNRRIKIPDGATKFLLNKGSGGDGNQTTDSSDLSYGAYYVDGGTKYVYLSPSETGWSGAKCYFYNGSGTVGANFPGNSMTSVGNGNYRIAVPVGATGCVFSNPNNQNDKAEVNNLSNTNCAFWLNSSRYPNQWGSAPADAGISTPMSAKRWDGGAPIDAGKASAGSEAIDYGFGIRMDMKFRVPNGGRDDDGKEVKFSYSGDDDLWVYITDRNGNSKLVLDLGGNHKKATGNISFLPTTGTTSGTAAVCKATADDVYGSGTTETTFDFDYSQTYTMSIFYMERGLFESNCKMSFSMTLPENDVIVDKTVNIDGVNSGIKSTTRFKNLVNNELFNFYSYRGDDVQKGLTYSLSDSSGISENTTNSSNGMFRLKDKQSADFINQFTNGDQVYVREAIPSTDKLSYDTSWVVTDLVNNDAVLGTSNGLTGSDLLKTNKYVLRDTTTGADIGDYAELKYSFTNKIKTAPLSITKTVKDYLGNTITSSSPLKDDTFTAQVKVDLGDGNGYQSYNLAYTDSDGNSGTGSTITLKHGRTVTITGIPVNAKYKVEETVPASYTNSASIVTGTMDADGETASFTNTEKAPASASAVIKAKKSLKDDKGNDVSFTDDSFTFELYSGTSLIQSKTVSSTTKEVSFDAINYDSVGERTYTIKEKQESGDGMITYDTTAYTVTVNVTKNGSQFESTVSYTGTGSASTPPTFNNVVKTGSVSVDKSNQAGDKLKDVTFTLYKVTKATADANSPYETVVANGVSAGSGDTDTNGTRTFSGLPVYENNTYDSASPAYQYYALLESATGSSNYRLNRVVKYFCFNSPTDLTKNFSYVNGHLRAPTTAGEGMAAAFRIGLFFIALSGVSALIYKLIKRPKRKKLAHLRA